MRRKLLPTILLCILLLALISAAAFAATPRGQMVWALGSLPSAAGGMLHAVAAQALAQVPTDQTFETWTTLKVGKVDAPRLNDFAKKLLQAARLQVDACYDNDTAQGSVQIALTSGGIPAAQCNVYLGSDTLAFQSPELLDRPVLLPIPKATPGTPLGRRLEQWTALPMDLTAKLTLAATKTLAQVPARDISTQRRQVTLLGAERTCDAVTLKLQGEPLADVVLPLLQAAANDGQLRQVLHALGFEGMDTVLADAGGNPQALRQRLTQAQLTLTVLRWGLQPVGWKLEWQQPDQTWSVELVACSRDGQADGRVNVRGLGQDLDVALLQTKGSEGQMSLTAHAALGQRSWDLTSGAQGFTLLAHTNGQEVCNLALTPQADGKSQDVRLALSRWWLVLEGDAQRTTTGSAPDIAMPQWEEDAVARPDTPTQWAAVLGRMGERGRTLAASYGIKAPQ